MSEQYTLAHVLVQLGEELRRVQEISRQADGPAIVAVTGARAKLEVAIKTDGRGGLSFGVFGIGIEAGGGLAKETTTVLEVDLHVLTRDEGAEVTSGTSNYVLTEEMSNRARLE